MGKKKQAAENFSREELLDLVRQQERKIAELLKKVAELLKENQALKRAQHRQATPFSKQNPATNPKKPGRKKGQGPFRRRDTPAQNPTVTVDAGAPPQCPFCGGPLEHEGEESATTTNVPQQPQPEVHALSGGGMPVYAVRQNGAGHGSRIGRRSVWGYRAPGWSWSDGGRPCLAL